MDDLEDRLVATAISRLSASTDDFMMTIIGLALG